MSETSGFFDATELTDGTYDRAYVAQQFADYFKLFVGNGVFVNPTDQLKILSNAGMNIKMSAGWAFVNGYWFHNDTNKSFTVPANSAAGVRTDSIMIQFNLSDRSVSSVYASGRTTVNRVSPYYELKIAEITVAAGATSITDAVIKDTRSDESVCGFVKGLVDVISTDTLFQQFTTQFDEWFQQMKDQLSTDAAGKLQTEIDTEISDRKTAVLAEENARKSADTGLSTNISTVAANLSTETANRTAAITAEATTRAANDYTQYHATFSAASFVSVSVKKADGTTTVTEYKCTVSVSGITATTLLTDLEYHPTGVPDTDETTKSIYGTIVSYESGAGTVSVYMSATPSADIILWFKGRKTA